MTNVERGSATLTSIMAAAVLGIAVMIFTAMDVNTAQRARSTQMRRSAGDLRTAMPEYLRRVGTRYFFEGACKSTGRGLQGILADELLLGVKPSVLEAGSPVLVGTRPGTVARLAACAQPKSGPTSVDFCLALFPKGPRSGVLAHADYVLATATISAVDLQTDGAIACSDALKRPSAGLRIRFTTVLGKKQLNGHIEEVRHADSRQFPRP